METMRSIFLAAALMCWAPAAAAQSLEERQTLCLACHGERGQSETPDVPSLGAQPIFYLTIQLVMFRDRLRVVEVMNEVMKGLSDNDLRSLADFIAKLPVPQPDARPADPVRMGRAQVLLQQHRCNICHGPNFAGQENVPRLAAQREDYLIKTLREYKDNTRRGYDASMSDIMHPITDQDILDMAHFLARVK
jgi:cytochrome c553